MKRATACLLPLVLLGCQRRPPAPAAPPQTAAAATVAGEADPAPMAEVTRHRWWAAEVQPDDVEKVVDAVQAQGKGALVLVDRRCRVSVVRDREKVLGFRADRRRLGKDLPDRVYFDLDDYSGRPAWGRVLRDLKAGLDRSDLLAAQAPGGGPVQETK
jgi:hypothetical protein